MKKKSFILSLIIILSISLLIACTNTDEPVAPAEPETPLEQPDENSDTSAEVDWPNGPITLLIGYSAGGSSDLGGRFLATGLEKQLGVPIIVENKPGSGSWVAWNDLLYNREKDGNTFALTNLSVVFGAYDEVNPREETMDDFELLANQMIDNEVIAIRTDETRFTDWTSLIEYGRENELLSTAATTNITSGEYSAIKWMNDVLGTNVVVVPVEGSKDAETMFISKNTDFLVGNVGDTKVPHERGDYKVIVVFAEERSELLPDVPTAKELGLGDYVSFSARGYSYAKGVDPVIVEKMTEALAKAITDPEVVQKISDMGAITELYTGEEYRELLESQLDFRLKLYGLERK